MSKTTKIRAKVLRGRPEIARLRAVGGLSPRVLVDGASILAWCSRSKANYRATISAIVDAANDGKRELVLVEPKLVPPVTLSSPHVRVLSPVGVGTLLRGEAAGTFGGPAFPSTIVADIEHDRQLFDILAGGARSLLDIASGRLWHGGGYGMYDAGFAAERGYVVAQRIPAVGEALVDAVTAPLATRNAGQIYVVCAFHRKDDGVVLDRVAVDDGQLHHAEGHAAGLRLLRDVVARGARLVMTSSMDVMDALHDAGEPLPERVEDPALACVVLDPDTCSPPPGVGSAWRATLSAERRRSIVRPPVDLVLDELPALHQELRDALQAASLLALYEDDVCATLPRFAALERGGFHIDQRLLGQHVAAVEAEMDLARAIVLDGDPQGLSELDLLRAPKELIGSLIQGVDGPLPLSWRVDGKLLKRLTLYGNRRARAVQRLRGLDVVRLWMRKLEGLTRLRAVLEPRSTGRWYPHDEALANFPKRLSEAMILRSHLVPEPGHRFVSGDYAAFEPRLLAHLSRDRVLVDGCAPGEDIYLHLMPRLGVGNRDVAKQALNSFINGMSPLSFAAALAMPLPDGHGIYKKLEELLADAIAFRTRVHQANTRSASSLYGWRRQRGQQSARDFAGQAFNLKMQGSAADLLRKLLRDLASVLPPDARVVHQVFDAVVLTCPAAMVATVETILKKTMENVDTLSVPLVAKTKRGATLADVS